MEIKAKHSLNSEGVVRNMRKASQQSKASHNAPITIMVTNFTESHQLEPAASMKECLWRIRKFIEEQLPNSNFLRFLDDKGAKPCVQYINPIFIITDNVCIMVDSGKILFEFSELNSLFIIVENGSFNEIVNIFEKAFLAE